MSDDERSWWVCTAQLRWLIRTDDSQDPGSGRGPTVWVLQQRWEEHFRSEPGMSFDRPVEWRDVPTVDEST
jgi:hypothetical protein